MLEHRQAEEALLVEVERREEAEEAAHLVAEAEEGQLLLSNASVWLETLNEKVALMHGTWSPRCTHIGLRFLRLCQRFPKDVVTVECAIL